MLYFILINTLFKKQIISAATKRDLASLDFSLLLQKETVTAFFNSEEQNIKGKEVRVMKRGINNEKRFFTKKKGGEKNMESWWEEEAQDKAFIAVLIPLMFGLATLLFFFLKPPDRDTMLWAMILVLTFVLVQLIVQSIWHIGMKNKFFLGIGLLVCVASGYLLALLLPAWMLRNSTIGMVAYLTIGLFLIGYSTWAVVTRRITR